MLGEDEQASQFAIETTDVYEKTSSQSTITRRELARAVASTCSALPQSRAATLVDEVLEEIAAALIAGENVTLCNFGKFVLVDKKERKGRNPRTGDMAVVLPRRVASFRPARHLKTLISKNGACLRLG